MQPVRASAVIICANAAATIGRCLDALTRFDEVVVYLNGSDDGTEEICRGYSNVSVHQGEFAGFGPTKNAALDCARNDWVLSVDSDEYVDESLVDAIASLELVDGGTAYQILRKNLFCGKHVDKGGWGNDLLLRFFDRRQARFNDNAVHEKVICDAGVQIDVLQGVLWHDAVISVDQFLQKISRYTELAATGSRPRLAQHPALALLRATFAFLRSYFLQLGILAGWRGVVIAFSEGTGTFFKYAKRYSKSRGYEQ